MARPLRVALAIGSLQVGGTESQLVKLAGGLTARGHEVHVLALGRGGPYEEELRALGVPTRVFGFGGLRLRGADGRRSPRPLLTELGRLLAVWRHLRALRPDVCHAFLFTCYTHVLPLAWLAGVPVRVNGRRGDPPPAPTGALRRLLDLTARRSSTLYVTNSRALSARLTRVDRVPPNRIKMIENGVEPAREAADPARCPPRGIVVANLIAYKGHADLIEAMALLEKPPYLCLVGDGPEHGRLAALVRARRLDHVVTLAGGVPDARALLASFQFAVLPSHQEGLPNAVLEAMAAGLPLVATEVGGVPDVVTDGETGLLVPPRDPSALAKAIERLAADPELRAAMGAAGRRVAARLSVEECAARHEAAYRAPPR
jgi:glycosyltransferase involved in cell wall biosynthesis